MLLYATAGLIVWPQAFAWTARLASSPKGNNVALRRIPRRTKLGTRATGSAPKQSESVITRVVHRAMRAPLAESKSRLPSKKLGKERSWEERGLAEEFRLCLTSVRLGRSLPGCPPPPLYYSRVIPNPETGNREIPASFPNDLTAKPTIRIITKVHKGTYGSHRHATSATSNLPFAPTT